MRRRVLSMLLCATMIGTLLVGCGGKDSTSDVAEDTSASETEDTEEAADDAVDEAEAENTEREIIDFWYLWSGDGESGAGNIEAIIDAYNASQDKYEVVGLSVPDMQKIVTAISGGTGPDITDAFMTSVPNYAEENIARPLDDLIEADNLDMSVFNQSVLEKQQYNGVQYALPINCNAYILYYNKDILEEAGYTELPKTMEELIEMGKELTIVENGEITQMGLILPNPLNSLVCSAGYDYGTVDEVSITNDGVRQAFEIQNEWVEEFGSDTLTSWTSSASSMWWGEEDFFRKGEVAFRIDGPWFYKMAVNSGINTGAMLIPSFADQGDSLSAFFDSSNLYIPSTADGVEGAWDFMKFFAMGEGAKMFATTDGSVPALPALAEDPDVIATFDPDGAALATLTDIELKSMPLRIDYSDYSSALSVAADSIMLGKSVDEVMAELQKVEDACNNK